MNFLIIRGGRKALGPLGSGGSRPGPAPRARPSHPLPGQFRAAPGGAAPARGLLPLPPAVRPSVRGPGSGVKCDRRSLEPVLRTWSLARAYQRHRGSGDNPRRRARLRDPAQDAAGPLPPRGMTARAKRELSVGLPSPPRLAGTWPRQALGKTGACVDAELTARCSRSPGDVAFSKTTNFLPCFPGKERSPLPGALNAGSFPSRSGQPGVQAWPRLKDSKYPASRQTQTAVYASRRHIPEPAAAPFLLKSH
ncbi:uncharacterized protein LOC121494619 isoform X1 [Vulpes lagopus]|uniref:uncharacterized protein LOC121494619 isoform X1 n=1 Tax=Vulpes lagopus TaxID=494514 RepID=UPI001BCA55B7|nr:uncharacterized protein LOC121494619 isoform X1 [Vulpes lagopus]